jgi:hypothetical protein
MLNFLVIKITIMKKNIFLILVLLMVSQGCKKEKSLPPVIEIEKPFSGEQYTYGDTIFYNFNVSDDEAVTNVKVSISNSAYQAVISYNFINAGKYKEYSGIFLTEGIPITGSTYHFVVSATDGENETKAGRQLSRSRRLLKREIATSDRRICVPDNTTLSGSAGLS